MDYSPYRIHLRQFMDFLREQGIDTSLPARKKKAVEELIEMLLAESKEDLGRECADGINVLFSIMEEECGVHDPLHLCYLKLRETRAKYLRCPSILDGLQCGLPKGHKGDHSALSPDTFCLAKSSEKV